MNILSKLYYRYKKILKTIRLYLIVAGPGIIVMVADNDAGGIMTYTTTGAQYDFYLTPFQKKQENQARNSEQINGGNDNAHDEMDDE